MKKRKGFTLVELVIVIAVIAILAAVLLPTFANVIESAKESSRYQRAVNAEKEVISSGILPEDTIGFIYGVDETGYYIVNESAKLEKITKSENEEYIERVDVQTGIDSVKLYIKAKVVGRMKINGTNINITDINLLTYFNYSGALELKSDYASTLEEIVLPTSIMVYGAEYVNYSLSNTMFANCTNLTKITIPANVTLNWGNLACPSSGLEVIFEEGTTVIANGLFNSGPVVNIKSISLPSTLERIEIMAFSNCNFEEGLVIPASVNYVGGGVIMSSTIPSITFEDPTGWLIYGSPADLSDPVNNIQVIAGPEGWEWKELTK